MLDTRLCENAKVWECRDSKLLNESILVLEAAIGIEPIVYVALRASFRVLTARKLQNVVSQLSQINRRYHYGLMLADGCRGKGLWPAKSFAMNDGRDRAIDEN
jgi:hypothetical protein